jgi:hypothetical protein
MRASKPQAQKLMLLVCLLLCSGLTTAKQLPAFRATNMITVKKFDHTKKAAVPLPSNKNAKHTYGMPSAFRTADIIRNCGPEEPPMKHLVQVGGTRAKALSSSLPSTVLARRGASCVLPVGAATDGLKSRPLTTSLLSQRRAGCNLAGLPALS